MARRKKQQHQEEGVGEGWLLPYSDMLTLLLGLFIVVAAMSNVDSTKFNALKTEFNQIMALNPVNSGAATNSVIDTGKSTASATSGADSDNSSSSSLTSKEAAESSEKATESSLREQKETQQLKQVAQNLQSDIKASGNSANASVSVESDGIHLTLSSNILFNSGSADLTSSVKTMLSKLVPDIKKVNSNPVVIAGYTDNVPSNTAKYPSNWELSSARALTVMRYFVSQGAISQSKVSIQAYGENNPKASNSTAAGRAQNRRVEIIIQRTNS